MKLIPYLRYFRFIWKNWHLRLALFSLRHELRGEKKYGIDTIGFDDLTSLEVMSPDHRRHAYFYQPVNYFAAEKAFDILADHAPQGALVDFGCGKGRILAVAAHYGFTSIKGIEFAPALCDAAARNIRKLQKQFPQTSFQIICGDAAWYQVQPDDGVFTFFNPFDQKVMLAVVRQILKSAKQHPRDLYILYFNPTEEEVLLSAGFREVSHYSKMTYINFTMYYRAQESDD